MRYHRIWELLESLPYIFIMESWFKIIRHTLPSIYEIDMSCFFPIDIVCVDSDLTEYISAIYPYTDFLHRLTESASDEIFAIFYFASWDSPVQWPIP